MAKKGLFKPGFTLVELMIVVAIIAFLAMIAIPSFLKFSAKAKRSEAYLNLGSIYAAQKAFFIENGKYSDRLSGEGSIQWAPEGSPTYTYGFAGSEGVNYIPGKSKDAAGSLANVTKADETGFTVAAVADIDGDGKMDIITVNEKHEFKIAQDDLA